MELKADTVPRTADNFRQLCTGESEVPATSLPRCVPLLVRELTSGSDDLHHDDNSLPNLQSSAGGAYKGSPFRAQPATPPTHTHTPTHPHTHAHTHTCAFYRL